MSAEKPNTENQSSLSQGNKALREKRFTVAVAFYLQALDASPGMSKAIAANLAMARRKYKEDGKSRVRKHVAVCGWELSHNAVGRVYTLAKLYETFADVEIIGSLFRRYGGSLWEPIRGTSIPVRSFVVERDGKFLRQALDLVAAHPYDVVHLSKPRAPNILFGALYKLVWDARVIVDIDDEEVGFGAGGAPLELEEHLKAEGGPPPLENLDGPEWTRLAVGLAGAFDGVTVSNPALQKRYGGEIVRHARDEKLFRPSPERRRESRRALGIGEDKKVLLFLGTPRAHKGLLETAEAVGALGRGDLLFAIVGDFPDPGLKRRLLEKPGVDYLFLGNQPFDKIPDITAAGDYCVLLQDPASPVSQFQIPAKLSDALAMGLAVLASDVPPLRDLFACGASAKIAEGGLAKALAGLLGDPGLDRSLRAKGLEYFNRELSWEANVPRLEKALRAPAREGASAAAVRLAGAYLPQLGGLAPPPARPAPPAKAEQRPQPRPAPAAEGRVAVAVHYFYPKVWPQIAARLKALDSPFDLFVTAPAGVAGTALADVAKDFPAARFQFGPNRGMDILPFLSLVPTLINEGYAAVCKLHTKKGDGGAGRLWRDAMLDALVGSSRNFAMVAKAFAEQPALCLAGPAALYQSGPRLMYDNLPNLLALLDRAYGQALPGSDWGFFAGTMFWARPELFGPISKAANFSLEEGDPAYKKDGKIEHALERFFGLAAALADGKVGLLQKRSARGGECCLTVADYSASIGKAHVSDVLGQFARLEADAKTVEDSGLFDAAYYLEQCPDLKNSGADCVAHYLTVGTHCERYPNRCFIPREYRALNADVVKAKIEPFVHYLTKGARENRRYRQNPGREQNETPYFRYKVLNRALIDWRELELRPRDPGLASIVIPVYGQGELTEQCILSILRTPVRTRYEILCVDNGSDSGTAQILKRLASADPRVRLISNPENFNFALGCNLGFSNSAAEAVVFLNNDTTVTPGWLDVLLAPLADPSIAAVQPKLVFPDGTIQCAGVVFSDLSPLGYPLYAGAGQDEPHANKSRAFQAVSAACVAVRAADFISLEGFDPTFINGQEDVDLCLRLTQGGGRVCWYEASSLVYHHESKSVGRGKYIELNRRLFVRRWGGESRRDDYKYYAEDKLKVIGWAPDNEAFVKQGLAVYRPVLKKTKVRRLLFAWHQAPEARLLSALHALESQDPGFYRGIRASVIMPAYNREGVIATAIESALAQSHRNFELLVVDDGSTDGTEGVARRFAAADARVKYAKIPHAGVSAARNKGLETATGEYVFYLDSDNRWDADFLRNMLVFMSHGRLAAAYCAIQAMDDEGRITCYRGDSFDWGECWEENYIDLNGFAHARDLGEELRFDTGLVRLVDWDFILRLTAHRRTAYAPFIGVTYYDGDKNSRITRTEYQGATLKKMQEVIRNKHGADEAMARQRKEIRPGWDDILGAAGAARPGPLTFRIKIGAPSMAVCEEWGDYHFALAIQRSLRKLGCSSRIDCLDAWEAPDSLDADAVLVLRGLSRYKPKPHQANLMWNISHPDKIGDDEYNQYDHVFVASLSHAATLSRRLAVPVSPLLQCTDPELFHPGVELRQRHEVLFVGNSRNVFRQAVKDALAADLPVSVFGTRWEQFLPAATIKGEHIKNTELAGYYAAAGVLLNDHWDTMRGYGFLSNRLFDAAACGARIVSDDVEGLAEVFGGLVATYNGAAGLREAAAQAMTETEADRRRREELARAVIENHSFDVRVRRIHQEAGRILALRAAGVPDKAPMASNSHKPRTQRQI